ncbi:MAG: chaperonin GroES [Parcubacteria group bacterium Gr01-1014_18]|nr:MAG: chaperonin GroES [Parcubacteria group bacterium Greene0416_36]TSC80285.1 MAG: chaperonin GroES [Parcubacteria group bacterium Gr01-1014_18]TSC98264.1 MAG: chaperonin GroES [Parcubacteria group bacterium Greene1014_20]TSD06993.1 MAG: chaperonin GroES [Parcubacteria group bacterium Greene0714_2]
MATLKPLGNHVIVKPMSANELSKSGIILPDTASKDRPEKGEIIAVGPGKMLENGNLSKMSVSVGQKVVFKKHSPDEVKVGDEEYLVISESDILAVLE